MYLLSPATCLWDLYRTGVTIALVVHSVDRIKSKTHGVTGSLIREII